MLQPMKDSRRLAAVSVSLLLACLFWDASGLDMALAMGSGGADGFPLRENWLLTTVLHDGGRRAAWALVVALCALVIWPVRFFMELPFARRMQVPATALLATAAVSLLKHASATSCPWELAEFGGIAQHLSHWRGWFMADGGGGGCFPGGHAGAGFAFVGGWFALRQHFPVAAKWCLAGAIAAGFTLGIAQQLRGAHFMSHTLWTGWICWMVAWLADPLFDRMELEATA